MINILDLFKSEELTEKSDGNFKTICPDCGLQGGRTEGFILFPENNRAYCHSSHKNFNLLTTAGLKFKIIKCLDGCDSGEKIEVDNDIKNLIYESIREKYDENFYIEFQRACESYDYFLIEKLDSKGKISKIVDIDKVADYIINKYNIKTIYGLKEENIYVYENGIWNITGKGLIKSTTEDLLDMWSKNNIVNEVLEKIKRKTEISKEEFDNVPEYKRCFINGVLDIEDIENIKFLPHSKEYNFKTKFPIIYDKKNKCPKNIKFIKETFYPEDIPQVQEWFGLHLPKIYLYKKAVIIHGPKNTGKSVFLNLLTKFLGIDNVSDLSLQKISSGKGFDLLVLKNKYGNIHDDLSSKDLNDGGGFKMSVGDGYISGEQKFGDHDRFRNSAKQTFACNKIPSVKDIDDDAYYDRFLPWKLDNVVDSNNKNIKLINELTTPEELSGLLNWALNGYYKLMKQNKFSNEKTSEEIKELMIEHGDTLAKFVSEKLIENAGCKITKEEMYQHYCHYCLFQKPKLSPCSKDQLGKKLRRYAPYISNEKSQNERYWLNVKFNSLSNMTPDTSLKITCLQIKNSINKGVKINNIKLPNPYLLSPDKSIKINKNLSKKLVTKKKTEREMQFWEIDECKDIVPTHTKEQLYEWLKQNPNYTNKQMEEKWGVGCFGFHNELIREGLIEQN